VRLLVSAAVVGTHRTDTNCSRQTLQSLSTHSHARPEVNPLDADAQAHMPPSLNFAGGDGIRLNERTVT